jgi:hypothetical protein
VPATLDSAFAAAIPGFLAYFGTYEIDEKQCVVTHNVIASSFPPFVGTQNRRRFEIVNDQLTLRDDLMTSDGVAVAAATIWQRVS